MSEKNSQRRGKNKNDREGRRMEGERKGRRKRRHRRLEGGGWPVSSSTL